MTRLRKKFTPRHKLTFIWLLSGVTSLMSCQITRLNIISAGGVSHQNLLLTRSVWRGYLTNFWTTIYYTRNIRVIYT